MKIFTTTAMLQRPADIVWLTMRDHLSDVADGVGDIRTLTTVSRIDSPEVTHLVNLWEASPAVPPALAGMLPANLFRWADRAEWWNAARECRWSIEPAFAPDRIRCRGVTHYEQAMGGRGTRITFQGELHIAAGGPLMSGVAAVAESFIAGVIPKNFQNLAHSAGRYLERQALTR